MTEVFASIMVWLLIASAVLSVAGQRVTALNKRLRSLSQRLVHTDCRSHQLVIPVIVVCAFLPVVIVFPREHYAPILYGLLLLSVVLVQRFLGTNKFQLVLPLGVMILAFSGLALATFRGVINQASYPSPIASAVTHLRGMQEQVLLVSNDWGVQEGLSVLAPNVQVVNPDTLSEAERVRLLRSLQFDAIWLPNEVWSTSEDECSSDLPSVSCAWARHFHPSQPGSPLFIRNRTVS